MTLKISFKEFISLFLTLLILVTFLPFLPLSAFADDWERTQDYIVSFEAGLVQNAGNAVISYYTSVDPVTLEVCEQALAFGECVVLDSLEQDERDGSLSSVGASKVCVGCVLYKDGDGSTKQAMGSIKVSEWAGSFHCSNGIYASHRYTVPTRPAYDISSTSARIYLSVKSYGPWDGFGFLSSYFDSSGSLDTHDSNQYSAFYSGFIACKGFNAGTVTPTSLSLGSSGISGNTEVINIKSGQNPIDVSPDYSSPEALYQSSQDYYNGLLEKYDKDLVDQFWFDFPDPAQEDTTESSGSGCCCEPFELPSEWVQSDVVELETEHYTIPYTDLVRNPYDYLVYGVTAPPPPVTPADNAKSAAQTKTATKATRSGDPVQDLKNNDPEMYEALFDYSALIQDILDRSGVLPYWAILLAAGALFLII